MKQNKALKVLAKAGKNTAVKQAGFASRWMSHQPKVPAKLLNK